ncbi:MAG: right-handed parallel beta-helix repeat-containing protein [Planctomycetota bacterium]
MTPPSIKTRTDQPRGKVAQPTEAMRDRVIKAPSGTRGVVEELLKQLDALRSGKTSKLVIPPGRHDVFPDLLPARACYISNNDSGIRPVLFDLVGLNGVEIDGQDASFVFHGEVIPFMVERCCDVRIANLRIDWARPFLSQGLILDADEHRLRLEMHPDHPFEVRDGRVVFVGDRYESAQLRNLLAFDASRCETAFRATDHYGVAPSLRAESDGRHRLSLFGEFTHPSRVGHTMVIKHHGRRSAGLCFSHCRDVSVEDVTVYHAGGMAFVGQATRNISLRGCRVEPTPGSGRVFSAHADATHFTDCHGMIKLIDCHFANQLDDATNIHGIYRRISGSGSTDCLQARLVHHQQDGVETVSAGDTIALFDDRNFAEIGRAEVSAVSNPDSRSAVYELKQNVTICEGHTVAMRLDHDINVHISGCEARGNRARGFLISTLGRVVIEYNRLHVPGSAVQFNFDGNSWYESGPVEDVTIRNNRFENCMYGVWGPALFSVRPEIDADHRTQMCNRNIAIHDNDIVTSDPRMVYARSVSGLRFQDNTITWNDAYLRDHAGPVYDFHESTEDVSCQDVVVPN